ncbi:hypothetical protein EMCG_07953 [[Emmonsia] crescens]|uniref:Uncharacterized protein n=1 Tax=[Emmonsia] crescens TaxID=73230 RepID=A0A0G2I6U3_9EURO|nr:hypothetical protein EMCG_07953 [Emmonsia crescens UAMH 3008]
MQEGFPDGKQPPQTCVPGSKTVIYAPEMHAIENGQVQPGIEKDFVISKSGTVVDHLGMGNFESWPEKVPMTILSLFLTCKQANPALITSCTSSPRPSPTMLRASIRQFSARAPKPETRAHRLLTMSGIASLVAVPFIPPAIQSSREKKLGNPHANKLSELT